MNATLETLKAAGLKPKATVNPDGSARITVWTKSESQSRDEKVTIDVDAAGKVTYSSKYAYLLPESVGDEIRLG